MDDEALREEATRFRQDVISIHDEVGKVIAGQKRVVECTVTALVAGGNVLLEGVPGLGKTELVKTLAKVLATQDFDAILIEDYDKGALSPTVIDGLLRMARERDIPVTVDPKFRHFELYRGVALFKPNLKELKDGLGLLWENGDVEAALHREQARYNAATRLSLSPEIVA